MKLFENGVGRPSNEIKKKRRIFIVTVSAIIIALISVGYYALFGVNVNKLEGATATKSSEQKAIEQAKKEKGKTYPSVLLAAKASGFKDEALYKAVVEGYYEATYNTSVVKEIAYKTSLTKKQINLVKQIRLTTKNINYDFTGLNQLKNLENLFIYNTTVKNLNLSSLKKLNLIAFTNCNLENIQYGKHNRRIALGFTNTNITSVNFSNLSGLWSLQLEGNKNLKNINVSNNKNLTDLTIRDNAINSINLEKNTKLKSLYLENSNVKSLDLSKNTELGHLSLLGTPIVKTSLSNNKKLYSVSVDKNIIKFMSDALIKQIKIVRVDEEINLDKFANIEGLLVGAQNTNSKLNSLSSLKLSSKQKQKIKNLSFFESGLSQSSIQSFINDMTNLTSLYINNDIKLSQIDLTNSGKIKRVDMNVGKLIIGDNVKLDYVGKSVKGITKKKLQIRCSNNNAKKMLMCVVNEPNIKVSLSNKKIITKVSGVNVNLTYKNVKKGIYGVKISKVGFKTLEYKFKVN